MKRDYGPAVSKDKHASQCFDEMLANEEEFAGEWVPFYHSYSVAALLYEVQAAVAAVLFRFKSDFASLPRILHDGFDHIPTASRTKAAEGIFGGTLPDWWSADDQSDASKMSAGRYGKSTL